MNHSQKKAIINATIIHDKQIYTDHNLLFDTRIIAITQDTPSEEYEIIDAAGLYVSAGFIDIHIHGSGGADVMDATPKALETISRTLPGTGTTSFIATTMTMRTDDIINAIENIKTHKNSLKGAKIAGIHLEGPFINPLMCGAQDAVLIQKPTLEWLDPYLDEISIVTLAPEMEGAAEFISTLREKAPHIVLSVGHSNATYDETIESFGQGVSHATHCFNAMRGFHHRDAGVVGAALDSDITVDVIADLVHTNPTALRLLHRLKNDRTILITDAMRAGCMCSGIYDLGGQRVIVEEGRATLENGQLAGSTLRLNEAIRNYIAVTGCSVAEALYMVTELPSAKLGLDSGILSPEKCADITIFDENIGIVQVYTDGNLIYEREK